MKLDLLYEVQAPKPWPDKPYPYDQREAELALATSAATALSLAVGHRRAALRLSASLRALSLAHRIILGLRSGVGIERKGNG